MKKIATTAAVILLAVSCLFAGDFKFLFTELDQHTEILSGFLPTLVTIGVGYNGLDVHEEDLSQLQLTVGGGYTQRVLYQNPKTGEPLQSNELLYDCVQLRWNLKFLQGFGESWVSGLDLVTAYFGYEGRFENNIDSMVLGQDRYRGYASGTTKGVSSVPSIDDWFSSPEFGTSLSLSTIYPDIAGDKAALMHSFYGGFKFNLMDDRMVSNEGFQGEVKAQYAPGMLNDSASFYSITLNLVAGTTLFEITDDSGLNIFSIVLIDRTNVNWTDGDKVPVFASMPVSLGRKVRGFNTNSYNTNFTAVNNLDIRIAGPEPFFDGVFPRLNLFVDVGYHFGNYLNTGYNGVAKVSGSNLLASCGLQLEACFFDFIDLGFQLSYLLSGDNAKTPGEKVITGATFFLDF